jgi:hypothetical protein
VSLTFKKQDHANRTGWNVGDSWMMSWGGDGKTYTNFSDGRFPDTDNVASAILTIDDDPPNVKASSFSEVSSNPLPAGSWGAHYIINTVFLGNTLLAGIVDQSGSGAQAASIARSDDLGKTLGYDTAKAMWPQGSKKPFVYPSFLQNGRGYSGDRDGYLYVFGSDGNWGGTNTLRLARVPTNANVQDVTKYEYYDGVSWTADLARAANVLEDGSNLGGMESILFNPVLGRYFLLTFAEPAATNARMVVYDAAAPWGPWSRCGTIAKADALFDDAPILHSVYNPSFNAKWIDANGDMWMSYSNQGAMYTFQYGVISIQPR